MNLKKKKKIIKEVRDEGYNVRAGVNGIVTSIWIDGVMAGYSSLIFPRLISIKGKNIWWSFFYIFLFFL